MIASDKSIETGDLITLAEAAERCELTQSTLRYLAWKGRLRAVKIGRDWFTTMEAVEEYLKSRQTRGAKPKSMRT